MFILRLNVNFASLMSLNNKCIKQVGCASHERVSRLSPTVLIIMSPGLHVVANAQLDMLPLSH
jgi:hypothetical protein